MNKEQVNHPEHYNQHPSGVECIDIIEHFTFNVGSVFKYLWRAGLKDANPTLQEFDKALWYLKRERERIATEQSLRAIVKEQASREAEKQANTALVKPLVGVCDVAGIKTGRAGHFLDKTKTCPKCFNGPCAKYGSENKPEKSKTGSVSGSGTITAIATSEGVVVKGFAAGGMMDSDNR